MSTGRRRTEGSCLAPLKDDLTVCDVPALVDFGKAIEVPQPCDHHHSYAFLDIDVVGNGVAVTGRPTFLEAHGALPVEVHRLLIAIQIREYRRQRRSSFKHVSGFGTWAVHEHRKACVGCEKRHLSRASRVSAQCA